MVVRPPVGSGSDIENSSDTPQEVTATLTAFEPFIDIETEAVFKHFPCSRF